MKTYPIIVAGGRVPFDRSNGNGAVDDTTASVLGDVFAKVAAPSDDTSIEDSSSQGNAAFLVPFRAHKRIATTPVGKPLRHLDCPLKLIKVMSDVMRVHGRIRWDAEILHRDISTNNVLFYETDDGKDVRGLLIDFDHAVDLSSSNYAPHLDRSGTLPFMSVNNLEANVELITGLDDWESALYMLCWIGTYGFNANLAPDQKVVDKLKIRKWCEGSLDDIVDLKRMDMGTSDHFYRLTEKFLQDLPMIECLEELVHKLRTTLFANPNLGTEFHESMGATCVGLWQKVQFNEHGRISGAKLVAFGLDRCASSSSFATATRRHFCTYLVIAKIGKPTKKSRPGNRGKRDSQMLLLHFLNRVHFEAPMSPLDLEIYHQMKNVIGVHPSLYEYLLMVDADTEVVPDSLTRLVACMVHDAKVIGICGETQLTNEDFSWTTMIQVYEYFISHHMAKAFESLFGSVTCLPGCFRMYRLRTARGMPLIISKNVVKDYSENHVDTLHKKNLLSLGEDRYLTTLMMKYFPQYKMTFTADAKCKTTAPDTWSVLLSQRRRWINSTVHNLVELVFLPEMCGFCCFSMRFVVFIDLFGTLTMPCTLFYLAYLAYLAISKIADIGYISLILIGAIYGLQAVIFVLKRQWQHIG
ncbi:hypothetical protein LPJ53_006140 [Coemansia erecta]|uniref:chitin synthase n=1 Tax=Coemansia erecta TaxID=147472 RepID=A0A9W8CN14_9FUNG|nr:hypothetical protein LPJ53_006140 [Coemansia erecta]